ncbi:MAG: hypothetical protein R2753_02900 [Chitinophagales bacterium]
MKNIFLAIVCLSFFVLSCDDEPTVDIGAPNIDFILPIAATNNEYFTDTNNLVAIKANISDNDELHIVTVSVMNAYDFGNGETIEMWRIGAHSHGTSLMIDTTYAIDTACHSNYYFRIIASDHNNNISRDSVMIYVSGKKGEECM